MPGFLMTIASKLHNIKHVIYVHGAVLYIQKNIIAHRLSKYVLSSCDLVFTNSEYMKKKLRTSLKIESEVVTPGYDSERFQNLNRDLRKTDILFAGNCIKRKGVHILLKAIIQNTEYYRENQLSVEICCSGVEKSNVVDLVKRKKLQDIITLKDKLTQEELVSAYNRSKIVVLPSLEEPLGLVGIEAIACGAFLVASKTGGIPEFVKHGENGLLFETGNSTALHSAVQSAFEKKLWSKNDKAQNDLSEELNNYSLCNGIKITILHFDALLTDAM
jgi:glycosyltransferase involved in cell wall biosynthesis